MVNTTDKRQHSPPAFQRPAGKTRSALHSLQVLIDAHLPRIILETVRLPLPRRRRFNGDAADLEHQIARGTRQVRFETRFLGPSRLPNRSSEVVSHIGTKLESRQS